MAERHDGHLLAGLGGRCPRRPYHEAIGAGEAGEHGGILLLERRRDGGAVRLEAEGRTKIVLAAVVLREVAAELGGERRSVGQTLALHGPERRHQEEGGADQRRHGIARQPEQPRVYRAGGVYQGSQYGGDEYGSDYDDPGAYQAGGYAGSDGYEDYDAGAYRTDQEVDDYYDDPDYSYEFRRPGQPERY